MNTTRRYFVGTVAAGLPLLIAGRGTALVSAQRGTVAPRRDPLVAQLEADVSNAVRSLTRGPSGEPVRTLASSLRVLSLYSPRLDLDNRVARALQASIRANGRDAILWYQHDPRQLTARARQLGFGAPSARLPVPTDLAVDPEIRRRVLDDLLAGRAAQRWRALADTLDSVSSAADRMADSRRDNVTLVAARQSATCITINQQLQYLSAEMAVWCGPWIAPWFPEGCALTTGAYLGVWATYWYFDCF